MITSFFPISFQVGTTKFSFISFLLNDLLFPEEITKICPEIEIEFEFFNGRSSIRQPILGISSLFGIYIGYYGSIKLLLLQKKQQQQQQKKKKKKSYFYWHVAFIGFGTMSLSAFILHCLVPSPSSSSSNDYYYYYHQQEGLLLNSNLNYPNIYPILWSIDTYMTGVSSIGLLVGSIQEVLLLLLSPTTTTSSSSSSSSVSTNNHRTE